MAGFMDRARGALGTLLGVEQPKVTPFAEMGVAGFASFGGFISSNERNSRLTGQQRYVTAQEILCNISIVAAGTRDFLNLLAKPKWTWEPADESDEAKQAVELIESIVDGLATPWHRVVRRAGMFKYHGFGIQEWTAKKRPDGKIGLLDIEPRPQHTITQWDVESNGDILGVVQTSPQDGQRYYLPRAKIVYMVDDLFTDSPEGMGWFRHLVEPSDRLKEYQRLEAAGFQKDLSGIPVGRAPISEMMGMVGKPKASGDGVWTVAEVTASVEQLRRFLDSETKSNKTSLMLDSKPYTDTSNDGTKSTGVQKWGLELLQGSAESVEEIGAAIMRLTEDMARIIGIENILTGNNSQGAGSNALSKDKSQNLYLAIQGAIGDMAAAYNRDMIGRVCDLNGVPEELRPKGQVEDVAPKDVEAISATLRDMATAGAVLDPSDPAINDVRVLLGISKQPDEIADRMVEQALMAAQTPTLGPDGMPLPPNGVPPPKGGKTKEPAMPDKG